MKSSESVRVENRLYTSVGWKGRSDFHIMSGTDGTGRPTFSVVGVVDPVVLATVEEVVYCVDVVVNT